MAEGSRSRLLAFAVAVHALAHRSATQRFEALRLRKERKEWKEREERKESNTCEAARSVPPPQPPITGACPPGRGAACPPGRGEVASGGSPEATGPREMEGGPR